MSKRTKKKTKPISSRKSQKIPKNLPDISVKKSMKESNKLFPDYYNLLFSLIRLNQKYNNFDLILNNKFNMELYIGFNSKITLPFSKDKFTKILKDLIDNYSSEKKRFIVLPVGICLNKTFLFYFKTPIARHRNIIIIDLKEKKAEYFEPHGGLYSKYFNNKLKSLKIKNSMKTDLYEKEKQINEYLKPIFKKLKIKFILPHQYLDKKDFQNVEGYIEPYIDHKSSVRKEDLSGYCQIWCIWFVSLRLKYPDTNLKELVKETKNILKTQYTYKNFIRNYAKDIYKENKKLEIMKYYKKIYFFKMMYVKLNPKYINIELKKHFTIYK